MRIKKQVHIAFLLFTSFLLVDANAAGNSKVISVGPGSCSAINDAIRKLPAGGGTVQLLAGVYKCKEPVVIDRNDVKLIGAGSKKVMLLAEPGLALPVLIIGATKNKPEPTKKWGEQFYPITETKNVEVSGLKIDGNYHAHKDPAAYECYDPEKKISLSCDNDGGRFIRNNGLTIRRSNHVRVKDLDTTGNFSGGIVLEKRSTDVVMDGFQANDNWFDGFAGYETSKSTFKNFVIRNNRFSGISVDMGFEGNTFKDGKIENNKDNGVFSVNVGSNTYDKVDMEGNGNYPFYMDGKKEFPNGPDKPAVLIPGTCENNVVKNSVLDSSGSVTDKSEGRASIRIDHVCKGTVLEKNKMTAPDRCVSILEGAEVSQRQNSCTKSASLSKSGAPTSRSDGKR